VASAQQENVDRRERLRRLAMETIDLAKDPYYMRNHLGQVRVARRWWGAQRIGACSRAQVSRVEDASPLLPFLVLCACACASLTPVLPALQIECRLCLTVHTNEGNYLAHTQVRRSCCIMAWWFVCCAHLAAAVTVRPANTTAATAAAATAATAATATTAAAATAAATTTSTGQGKRHQQNLAKRAAREAAERQAAPAPQRRVQIKKSGACVCCVGGVQ
jgi:hypothetical protein